MKLENEVVSLNLARKLKELGVKQESEFIWQTDYHPYGETAIEDDGTATLLSATRTATAEMGVVGRYSAFTVAELGEMLPNFAFTFKNNDGWNGNWKQLPNGHPSFIADTEADARAKMLIYLIEQGLINN